MLPSFNLMARVAAETLRISVPTVIDAALGNVSAQVCDERLDSWSARLVRDAGIQFEVQGREHIAKGESYIVMSNHQSLYDIPVLFQALQIPLRMVAKKEIFRIPFMAGAMRAAGFIEVDRHKSRDAMDALINGRNGLTCSTSVWIAPEGTRSRTGRLGEFKRGGFLMAVQNHLRILPVTIDGTRRALPAGSLTVKRGQTAVVTISAPIDATGYRPKHMNQLIAAVRGAIERHLPMTLVTPQAGVRERSNGRDAGAIGIGLRSQE